MKVGGEMYLGQTKVWWLPEGRGWERVKGSEYIVMEDDLTLDGGYPDHVSEKCILEIYIILLTVSPQYFLGFFYVFSEGPKTRM